eukprot:6198597-Pleurochrysis_carterae.AAC.1
MVVTVAAAAAAVRAAVVMGAMSMAELPVVTLEGRATWKRCYFKKGGADVDDGAARREHSRRAAGVGRGGGSEAQTVSVCRVLRTRDSSSSPSLNSSLFP